MTEWIISSSVLITAVLILRRVLRGKLSPGIQYALWAIVLIRLLMPFSLFSSDLSIHNVQEQVSKRPEVQQIQQVIQAPIRPQIPTQNAPQTSPQPQQSQQHGTQAQVPQQTPTVDELTEAVPAISLADLAVGVWITGIAVMAMWLAWCNIRFSVRLKRTRQEMGCLQSLLPVYFSPVVETPCLFGLFHPAVYLTADAVEDTTVLRYVLTHELTHYRQMDHLWAVLRAAALILHWYNPLVWIAFRASRQDCEMACDARTLTELGEEHRGNYGRTLVGLATGTRFRGTLVTATSMGGSKRAMKERIVILMKNPKTAMMTLVSLILVCALIVGCTFTSAVDRSSEPVETVPTETTEPVETTEPIETTTPVETVPLGYIPLSAEQIRQANEAFRDLFPGENGSVQVNPLNNFNTSYYSSPDEIDLYRFIYYFCYKGEFEGLDADFDRLAQKYPELENSRNGYNLTRYPADAVDEILYRYTGYHIEELYGTRNVPGVYYLEETDAYYSFSSDAGWVGLQFTSGRLYDGYAELYDHRGNVMTLVMRDGSYCIHSYLPHHWDTPAELTAYEIDQVNKAFASTMKTETIYGTSVEATPVNCFFTCYYENPTQIDLKEFLRHFTWQSLLANEYEQVTEEEFDHIRKLEGFWFPDQENLADMYVPIHKYPAHLVDYVLQYYTGVSLDALVDANGNGDAFYSEKYDAYYNHTSDFAPGMFHCIGGVNYGDIVELYSEDSVLILQHDIDGHYCITAHLPLEHHETHEGGHHHD